jgi:hypothetical protein
MLSRAFRAFQSPRCRCVTECSVLSPYVIGESRAYARRQDRRQPDREDQTILLLKTLRQFPSFPPVLARHSRRAIPRTAR